MKTIDDYIRTIPDFPKPGIMFRDITTVIESPEGFKLAVSSMLDLIKDVDFDILALAESRGFIFGSPIGYELNKPIVLVRKKGKLPCETVSQEYELEYGNATLEIHKDSIKKGDRVVIIDDLLATGGTLDATCKLVEKLGGEVACVMALIELKGLNGREKLSKYRVETVQQYEGA